MIDKYILFSVAGTLYALPTERIAHIEMVEHVTRVPNAPRFVDGVVFSRGEVVPAVSLRARFGFERAAFDTRTRLIVVRSGSRVVGLIVDAAREFTTIPESAIKPPHDAITGLSGEYLRGIATLADRLIVVLDIDAILDATAQALTIPDTLPAPSSQEIR
jgi:purine-binding chemotaxis protein CheW